MVSRYRDSTFRICDGFVPWQGNIVKLLVQRSAPPASHNANLVPLVEGPAISLAARRAKVRRAGYAR